MKIYVQEQRVTIVGKAWQVKYLLKKYMNKYTTVQELIDARKTEETRLSMSTNERLPYNRMSQN